MLLFLFRYHFRKEVRSLAICATALALTALLASVFAQVLNLQAALKLFEEAFKKIPVLAAALSGTPDMLQPWAVVAHALFTMVAPIVLTVYTAELAVGMYTREAAHGTLEFLFSLPVARRKLVASRVLVVFANLAVLSAALVVGLVAGSTVGGVQADPGVVAIMGLNTFALFVFLAGLNFFVSLAFTDPTRATLALLAVGFGLFCLNGMVGESMGAIRWANPFHYFAGESILRDRSLPWLELGVLGLSASAMWAAGVVLFVRKQI